MNYRGLTALAFTSYLFAAPALGDEKAGSGNPANTVYESVRAVLPSPPPLTRKEEKKFRKQIKKHGYVMPPAAPSELSDDAAYEKTEHILSRLVDYGALADVRKGVDLVFDRNRNGKWDSGELWIPKRAGGVWFAGRSDGKAVYVFAENHPMYPIARNADPNMVVGISPDASVPSAINIIYSVPGGSITHDGRKDEPEE